MSGRRRTSSRDTGAAARHGGATRMPGRDPVGSILALQRVAGNRALRQLLRAPKLDLRVPKDVAANKARPLPAVASLPGAGTATLTKDPRAGDWQDRGGTTYTGTVGAMQRILLQGLPGDQREQPAQKIKPPAGGPGYADAIGKGPAGKRGRAVAIVPPHLTAPSGKVAVVVHLHGNDVKSTMLGSMGMRSRGDRPEDVADFQIPQQVEAFVNSRPGARVVVLMPIGVTVPAGSGHTTAFGIRDVDAYVAACLQKLGLNDTPDGIYLSAHSGGGFTISNLVARGLPKSVKGVLGFESFHSSDLRWWQKLATDRLDRELTALAEIRRVQKTAPASEDEIAAAQIAYLRDEGFRFTAFGGGRYIDEVQDIRTAILTWFDAPKTRRKLKAAMGGQIRTDVLEQLWANFQASDFAGSSHMNALSLDSHFGQALAALPRVGALAPGGRVPVAVRP